MKIISNSPVTATVLSAENGSESCDFNPSTSNFAILSRSSTFTGKARMVAMKSTLASNKFSEREEATIPVEFTYVNQ